MSDFPSFPTESAPFPVGAAEASAKKTRGPRRGTVPDPGFTKELLGPEPAKRKGRPPKVEAKSRASAVIPAFRLSDLEHLDPADIEPITQAWQVLASLDDGQRARVLALLGKALA